MVTTVSFLSQDMRAPRGKLLVFFPISVALNLGDVLCRLAFSNRVLHHTCFFSTVGHEI